MFLLLTNAIHQHNYQIKENNRVHIMHQRSNVVSFVSYFISFVSCYLLSLRWTIKSLLTEINICNMMQMSAHHLRDYMKCIISERMERLASWGTGYPWRNEPPILKQKISSIAFWKDWSCIEILYTYLFLCTTCIYFQDIWENKPHGTIIPSANKIFYLHLKMAVRHCRNLLMRKCYHGKNSKKAAKINKFAIFFDAGLKLSFFFRHYRLYYNYVYNTFMTLNCSENTCCAGYIWQKPMFCFNESTVETSTTHRLQTQIGLRHRNAFVSLSKEQF